ncbi:hypothetical protein V8G54_021124 [Vigna mungo]|uniref:Uncharacterized protein n=1 Tax=Vigna mungo TaxID=3915 RepID=A0AAQ3NGU0_VIGMU
MGGECHYYSRFSVNKVGEDGKKQDNICYHTRIKRLSGGVEESHGGVEGTTLAIFYVGPLLAAKLNETDRAFHFEEHPKAIGFEREKREEDELQRCDLDSKLEHVTGADQGEQTYTVRLGEARSVEEKKIGELEKRLISLNSGDENAIRSVLEEFSSEVTLDEESILNKNRWQSYSQHKMRVVMLVFLGGHCHFGIHFIIIIIIIIIIIVLDEIGLVVPNDIDECNEWLIGQVDDDNDNDIEEAGNERQASKKRKQPSSGAIVIGSSYAFKKGPGATSASIGRKGKKTTQIGVEIELQLDSSDYEF